MTSLTPEQAKFMELYDLAIFSEQSQSIFSGSGFYNIGYWADGLAHVPENAAQASRALVDHMASFESPESTAACSRVLDVACGLGATTAALTSLYPHAEMHAINLSAKQVAAAQKRCPSADFRVMDAVHLEYPEASFDRIYCVEAIFYFDSRDAFLAQAKRVLKPGGQLIITDFLLQREAGLQLPASTIGTDPRVYTDLAAQAGLGLEQCEDLAVRSVTPYINVFRALKLEDHVRKIREALGGYYLVRFSQPA